MSNGAQKRISSLKPAVKSEFSNTKRGVLHVTGSVFDPLVLAAQYLIKTKLIIQEL